MDNDPFRYDIRYVSNSDGNPPQLVVAFVNAIRAKVYTALYHEAGDTGDDPAKPLYLHTSCGGVWHRSETEFETLYHFYLSVGNASRIAITISALLEAIHIAMGFERIEDSFQDIVRNANRQQYFDLHTQRGNEDRPLGSYEISGHAFGPLLVWARNTVLERNGDIDLQDVVAAMRETYHALDPHLASLAEEYEFIARIAQPGRLWLKIPGDSCDLGTDHVYDDVWGLRMIWSHNVDTPIDQLTLLAGFAKLAELAQEAA